MRHLRVLEVLAFAGQVQEEWGRTPGFWLAGLRAVDPRSGAERGLPAALARTLSGLAPRYVVKALVARSKLRKRADESNRRVQEIAPRIKALTAEHKDDPAAQQAAITELYKQEAINPLTGCGPTLAEIVLTQLLTRAVRKRVDSLISRPLIVEDHTRTRRFCIRRGGFL